MYNNNNNFRYALSSCAPITYITNCSVMLTKTLITLYSSITTTSQISLRIRVPFQFNDPKIEVKSVVFIPEVMHDFLRDLDAIPARRTHWSVIDFNLRFGRMVQHDLLLISACLFWWTKILGHNPHWTGFFVPLNAPEYLVVDLCPPKCVRESLAGPVELLAESGDVGIVV